MNHSILYVADSIVFLMLALFLFSLYSDRHWNFSCHWNFFIFRLSVLEWSFSCYSGISLYLKCVPLWDVSVSRAWMYAMYFFSWNWFVTSGLLVLLVELWLLCFGSVPYFFQDDHYGWKCALNRCCVKVREIMLLLLWIVSQIISHWLT